MIDVLIVGAGPAGLSLASLLQRHQISFRIIDQKEGISTHSKALAVQSRTLEVLEKLGLSEEFVACGLPLTEIFYHFKKKELKFQLEPLDTPYPFILILAQSESERILYQDLKKNGTDVEWNTSLVDLKDNKSLLQHANGEKEEVYAKWIVGCDGAHSSVRKQLKFSFKGTKYSEEFLIADIRLDGAEEIKKQLHLFIHPKGLCVLLPFPQKNLFRVIIPDFKDLSFGLSSSRSEDFTKQILKFPAEANDQRPFARLESAKDASKVPELEGEKPKTQVKDKKRELDIPSLTELLLERGYDLPYTISEIVWLSTFYIHRRISSSFRRQNVFLVGDAAHIHSPAGGQGMNTSIQDAFNLAWKLAYVIKKISPDSLLDSYEQERKPVAKKVLLGTSFVTKVVTFSQKYWPTLIYWLLNFVFSKKKGRTLISEGVSELTVNYRGSPIVREDPKNSKWQGPKPGERAPNALLGNSLHLYELLKPSYHHVLLFENHPSFIEEVHHKYGEWISVHVIKGEEAKRKYEAGPKSLYLVRPDGYIGYRSREFKREDFFDYLLLIFKPS